MLGFFPLPEPRTKQVLALERAFVHAQNGVEDIVIAAPTGIGKTGIGAAVCLWAGHKPENGKYTPGGYYLVTQKLLQDQITKDFPRYVRDNDRCASLKSAVEYPCPEFVTCMAGRRMSEDSEGKAKTMCSRVRQGGCRYILAKEAFGKALLSVTNYAYFFTERQFVKQFPKRMVLVADECHTLERQLMGFVEFTINKSTLEKWAPGLTVPKMTDVRTFIDWIKQEYLPIMENRMTMLGELLSEPEHISDPRLHDE
jgi:ATP-dependent DNA helicase DinG